MEHNVRARTRENICTAALTSEDCQHHRQKEGQGAGPSTESKGGAAAGRPLLLGAVLVHWVYMHLPTGAPPGASVE